MAIATATSSLPAAASSISDSGPHFSDPPTDQEILASGILPQPLLPTGQTTADENRELVRALTEYQRWVRPDARPEDLSPITGFIRDYPGSRWEPALDVSLGIIYRRAGLMSKAMESWQRGWDLTKDSTDRNKRAIADYAVGKLAEFEAYLGRVETLGPLLDEVKGRPIHGTGATNISDASQGLAEMRTNPGDAFRCGPMALRQIALAQGRQAQAEQLDRAQSTSRGTSLMQVTSLARKAGMNFQMAHRERGAAILVPAVMHWRVGHFAAIIESGGHGYQVEDPTFGENISVSRSTIDDESSGYFVVPDGPLPYGWRAVSAAEGERIWGRGYTGAQDPQATSIGDIFVSGSRCKRKSGMTVANAFAMRASLAMQDIVLDYQTPKGPPVNFGLFYAHRDAEQPMAFTYTNFGPKWTSNWLSYIVDNTNAGTAGGQMADLYMPGGGGESYEVSFRNTVSTFAIGIDDQAHLSITIAQNPKGISYTTGFARALPDGTVQTFTHLLNPGSRTPIFFLSSVTDPQGNTVTLSYDANNRLAAITDASAEVTTLTYGLSSDIWKVTKVTDPFGRSASFTYNRDGELASITDVLGILSRYAYLPNSGDFISSLATPYGTSTFTYGDSTTNRNLETTRFVTLTDPLGQTERTEFNQNAPGIQQNDPDNTVPTGMFTDNGFMIYRNSFVWDKHQLLLATKPDGSLDYTKATILHFLHKGHMTARVLESVKRPLEHRVWFSYPGQTGWQFPNSNWARYLGTSNLPNAIGRVLDDGTTELWSIQYNPFGHPTQINDPIGRQLTMTYAPNGIDLLTLSQTTKGANQLLSSATYNHQHEPILATDPSGQLTHYSYNTAGQLLSVTDALKETTSYTYNPLGLPVSIVQPLNSATTTIAYDKFNRVTSTLDPQGYKMLLDYDVADRPMSVQFPDATTVKFTYSLLDLASVCDRLKRTTQYAYDSLERLVQVKDPLGRITKLGYCDCGAVSDLLDPSGRLTKFSYDLEERLASKIFADGSTINLGYENTTSRLKSSTDALGQITAYSYNTDDTLHEIDYLHAINPTPQVSLTWDPAFTRVTAMTDGTGKTSYAYYPVASPPLLGATLLEIVRGPYNDTVAYTYDQLGRVKRRAIDGPNSDTSYDVLGRITNEANPLDTFNTSYLGTTGLPLSIKSANGLASIYTYFDDIGDERLKTITNNTHTGNTVSAFEYGYDDDDQITSTTVKSQFPSAISRTMGYDAAGQLLTMTSNGATSKVSFGYDLGSNRTSEKTGTKTISFVYNKVNELTSPGPATYDADGQPLKLGSQTFQWDAAGRLISVTGGASTTRFAYDGSSRRERITQLSGGKVLSDKRYFWCDDGLCLETDADNNNAVSKRYYAEGFTAAGQRYYYAMDNLQSVRQLVDPAGAIQASYDYDPYGVRTKLSGAKDGDFGFAGLFHESQSGVDLAIYRAYYASLGRWLSRDPIGEEGGLNLYAYADNAPVNLIDPEGAQPQLVIRQPAPTLQRPRSWAGRMFESEFYDVKVLGTEGWWTVTAVWNKNILGKLELKNPAGQIVQSAGPGEVVTIPGSGKYYLPQSGPAQDTRDVWYTPNYGNNTPPQGQNQVTGNIQQRQLPQALTLPGATNVKGTQQYNEPNQSQTMMRTDLKTDCRRYPNPNGSGGLGF